MKGGKKTSRSSTHAAVGEEPQAFSGAITWPVDAQMCNKSQVSVPVADAR